MQRKYLVLLVLVIVVIVFGLYKKGILFAPKQYPVLSGPSTPPFKEVPALFSQSGTVTAISDSSITIRFAKPAPTSTPTLSPDQTSTTQPIMYTTIAFPISSVTPVFSIVKEVVNEEYVLRERAVRISDITVGANVTIQIAQKTLVPVAPVKIQIFPK